MTWVIEKYGKYMSGSHFGKNQRTTYRWSKKIEDAFVIQKLDTYAHGLEKQSGGKLIPKPCPAVTVININSGKTTTGQSALDFIRADMR